MGLFLLLLLAAVLLLWMGVVIVLRFARHPTRDGIGRALAQGRPCEPSQIGLACTEWSYRASDGLELPAWDIDTGIDGPTLLWLHDWGGSRLALLPRLAAWGTWCGRIVVPDARGHGDAPGACTLGHVERDDLAALLEVIGNEPVVLAGEGLGAVLALEAARGGVVQPRGVFALDPFVSGSQRFRRCMRDEGFHSFPVADLALIVSWLGGRSPIELQCPLDGWRVPVLARFTGTHAQAEAAVFTSSLAGDSNVQIDVRLDEEADSAGAVDQSWW